MLTFYSTNPAFIYDVANLTHIRCNRMLFADEKWWAENAERITILEEGED
jgi:hypothetical protein